MNPFQSFHKYEEFIYTLRQKFPAVQESTLTVVRQGTRTAQVYGEVIFAQGFRVAIRERLSFDEGFVTIEDYGYEIWHLEERYAWYDAQPHPDDPSLAATFPHHKHVHPDIKHHRVPATKMSFTEPNLPYLILEVESLLT